MPTYRAIVVQTIQRQVWCDVEAEDADDARQRLEDGESDAESPVSHRDEVTGRHVPAETLRHVEPTDPEHAGGRTSAGKRSRT